MKARYWVGVVGLAALIALPLRGQVAKQGRVDPRAEQNERLYGFKGVVRGRVVDADGKPVKGVTVFARFQMHMTGAPGEGTAITDENGQYEIRGLGPEKFFVSPQPYGTKYLEQAPVPVDLTTPKTIEENFTLQDGVNVTVRVSDPFTGTPITGLEVKADNQPIGKTDADGLVKWRANGLRFSLSAEIYNQPQPQSLEQAPGNPPYRQFELKNADPVTWDLKIYRGQSRDTKFRGVVVDEQGNPVAGATVQALQYNEVKKAVTDRDGRFSVPGFRIQFTDDIQGGGLLLLADKGELSAMEKPKGADTWEEMKVVLHPNRYASVTGQVVDENGKPLAGCPVTYWAFYGSSQVQGSVQPSGGYATDAAGHYRVDKLQPGASYTFAFGGQAPMQKFGITHVPEDWPRGNSVVLERGEAKDLGSVMVPHADGKIAGTVLSTDGKPVTGHLSINVHGAHTDIPCYPDENGRFSADGLVDEPLTIKIFTSDGHFTRTGNDSPDLLLSRPIRVGQTELRLRVKMRPPKP